MNEEFFKAATAGCFILVLVIVYIMLKALWGII